ncbi:hypothetical protein MO973_25040 [Paenibacillus sp. TRM 82003]|nr:hypothetical protein [Paenibacillus sp. TRM 82003]MCI3923496.1 hypothetical protein [Paenibacillus sp. TRM 82003]
MAAWWSAAFPGLGHIMLCKYLVALVLIGWEVFINNYSHLNTSIYYTMVGDFDKAKEVLDLRWFLLYMPVYVFAIWDSYHRTVQYNKDYRLCYKTGYAIVSRNISSFELNKLEKRKPWPVVVWSLIAPGLGYLHINRLPSALLFTVWFVVIVYYSSALPAVHATFGGPSAEALKEIDVQWFLFLPSLYGFTVYEAYSHAVEYNKLYEIEQGSFLKKEFQPRAFRMPI